MSYMGKLEEMVEQDGFDITKLTLNGWQEQQKQIDILKKENERLKKDSERLRTLRKLVGYVQNGTHDTVTLCQDDATYTFSVRVGKRDYYGDSFEQAIDMAAKEIKDDF